MPAAHRIVRLAAAVAAVAAVAAGCASHGGAPSVPAGRGPGQHAFTADLPNGVAFRGVLVVTEDTIVPRPADGECRPAPGASGRTHIVYECGTAGVTGILLAFDRGNPLRRSTWGLATRVRKTRSICTEWRTWENGNRSCTRTEPEEYFESERLQGAVVITP